MTKIATAVVVFCLLFFASNLWAHNTGVPHREFTAEELRELGLEELIDPVVSSTTESQATTFTSRVHGPLNLHELLRTWAFDPGVVVGLGLSGLLYGIGVGRLWRATHVGAGITLPQVLYYSCGWIWLLIALVSPIHPWGEVLFSAHMVQHEILMLLAAPLLILGNPLPAFIWSLPRSWRKNIGCAVSSGWLRTLWAFLIHPLVAWIIHAIALWIWHIPSWFEATLYNDWIHSLQHMSFFCSALLFWFAVFSGHHRRIGYGMAVLYLFTTAVHSSVLGALLTFTTTPWYPAYSGTTSFWGLTLLEDQQLGGLIMWIPAGLIYIGSALILMLAWMNEAERRVSLEEITRKVEDAGGLSREVAIDDQV